jgi:hypothetical protein
MTAEIRFNPTFLGDVQAILESMVESGETCRKLSPPFSCFCVVVGARPAHPLTTLPVPTHLVDTLGSKLAYVAGTAHVMDDKDAEDAGN